MRRWIAPAIIEIVGIGIVSAGIGFEIATGADLGYLIICTGSVLVAGGGLLYAKILRR